MKTVNLDCQGCNNHCPLTVSLDNAQIIDIQGYCCHRGIVSARTQLEQKNTEKAPLYTGIKKMYCTGCSNACLLDVHLTDGTISELNGAGCRRGMISAQKKLNINV